MKKHLLTCLFFFASGVAAMSADTASPLAPVASLVGGVWRADVPVKEGQPPMQLEARFTWAENQQAIRFSSAFVRAGKPAPYTDGFYAWNATKGKLALYYTDSQGGLTEGLVTDEAGVLINDLTVFEKGGATTPVRSRMTKIGDDTFTNEIFLKKDGKWAPFIMVRYIRQK
ncbi:MAG: hypothetical protein ABIZ04_27140 [Opitutus sp.]